MSLKTLTSSTAINLRIAKAINNLYLGNCYMFIMEVQL